MSHHVEILRVLLSWVGILGPIPAKLMEAFSFALLSSFHAAFRPVSFSFESPLASCSFRSPFGWSWPLVFALVGRYLGGLGLVGALPLPVTALAAVGAGRWVKLIVALGPVLGVGGSGVADRW